MNTLIRIVRLAAVSGWVAGMTLGSSVLLCGCDSGVKEGTMVEKTPAQTEAEKASMKGMMDAMKSKTPKKR
jgi:hypothetical protein